MYGCCNQSQYFFDHSVWVCRSSKQIELAQQSGATLWFDSDNWRAKLLSVCMNDCLQIENRWQRWRQISS